MENVSTCEYCQGFATHETKKCQNREISTTRKSSATNDEEGIAVIFINSLLTLSSTLSTLLGFLMHIKIIELGFLPRFLQNPLMRMELENYKFRALSSSCLMWLKC